MATQELAMEELTMEQVEQVAGGDFSPGAASLGIGIASAAAGGAIFGPIGAVAAGLAYFAGYVGGSIVLRPMLR
jgi:hypothetical protein